jgi:hypothetical protein
MVSTHIVFSLASASHFLLPVITIRLNFSSASVHRFQTFDPSMESRDNVRKQRFLELMKLKEIKGKYDCCRTIPSTVRVAFQVDLEV